MKKISLFTLSGLMVIALAVILGATVYAQTQEENPESGKNKQNAKTGEKTFVDKNGDGICDLKSDCHGGKKADGCDGKSCGNCSEFKDKDGNGNCDKLGSCGKHEKKADTGKCSCGDEKPSCYTDRTDGVKVKKSCGNASSRCSCSDH